MLVLPLVTLLNAASAAPPRPPGPPPGPPPVELLVDRAAALDLAPERVDAMAEIVDAARPALDQARAQARDAHEALRAAVGAEPLDRDAVLAAASDVGAAEEQLRLVSLGVVLDLRELLDAETWRALTAPPPRPERPPGVRP